MKSVSRLTFKPSVISPAGKAAAEAADIPPASCYIPVTGCRGELMTIVCSLLPNTFWVAAAGSDGIIFLWDVKENTSFRLPEKSGLSEETECVAHEGSVNVLAFSPTDPDLLASGGADGKVNVWSLSQKKCCFSFVFGESYKQVLSLYFSQDGSYLLIGGQYHPLVFWQFSKLTQTVLAVDTLIDSIRAVNFCPTESNFFILAGSRGRLQVWDVAEIKAMTWNSPTASEKWNVHRLERAPAERREGNPELSEDIQIFTAQSLGEGEGEGGEIRVLELLGDQTKITHLACSSDGKWFASGSEPDKTVMIRDFARGRKKAQLGPYATPVRGIQFYRDCLLMAEKAGRIHVTDPDGKPLMTVNLPPASRGSDSLRAFSLFSHCDRPVVHIAFSTERLEVKINLAEDPAQRPLLPSFPQAAASLESDFTSLRTK